MTPLERAARALADYAFDDGGEGPDHEKQAWIDRSWRSFIVPAHMALSAIREPSEVMEDKGALAGDWNRDNLSIGQEAKKVYTAMIDAMLEEG